MALTLAQAVLLLLQAAWLTLGTYSNIRYPRSNRDYVVRVLTMEFTREDPVTYEDHSHRSLSSPRALTVVYRLIVATEVLVSGLLWLGALGLVMAAFGLAPLEAARAIALIAALGFTAIWGSFLVGGQWFQYWVSDSSPQGVHFSLLLWGLGTLILLR